MYFDEQQKAVSIYSLTAFQIVCLYGKSADDSLFTNNTQTDKGHQ